MGPVILVYNDTERKLAEDCVHRMVKRAVEMEGTVTVSPFKASHPHHLWALPLT